MNTEQNKGHGHVTKRPDGVRARCGGPAFCKVCQAEKAELERATAAPAESAHIETAYLCRLMLAWHDARSATGNGSDVSAEADAIFAHIDAWGARRYEAGRRDMEAHLMQSHAALMDAASASHRIAQAEACAERAEAALKECKGMLLAQTDAAIAAQDALASRPAVDMEQLLRAVARGFGHSGDTIIEMDSNLANAIAKEVLALLSGKVEAPTASPAAADADELHFNATRLRNVARLVGLESAIPQDDATLDGARGSVLGLIAGTLRNRTAPTAGDMQTTASADGLPPMPSFDMDEYFNEHSCGVQLRERYNWHSLEAAIKDYARQARADALEEVVLLLKNGGYYVDKLIADVRALNKKG